MRMKFGFEIWVTGNVRKKAPVTDIAEDQAKGWQGFLGDRDRAVGPSSRHFIKGGDEVQYQG